MTAVFCTAHIVPFPISLVFRPFLFQIFQTRGNVLNGFGPLGDIFTEQILLTATPNFHIFASTLFGRDNDTDGIPIRPIGLDLGVGKDRLDAFCGGRVFLGTPVSVAALFFFCVYVCV